MQIIEIWFLSLYLEFWNLNSGFSSQLLYTHHILASISPVLTFAFCTFLIFLLHFHILARDIHFTCADLGAPLVIIYFTFYISNSPVLASSLPELALVLHLLYQGGRQAACVVLQLPSGRKLSIESLLDSRPLSLTFV